MQRSKNHTNQALTGQGHGVSLVGRDEREQLLAHGLGLGGRAAIRGTKLTHLVQQGLAATAAIALCRLWGGAHIHLDHTWRRTEEEGALDVGKCTSHFTPILLWLQHSHTFTPSTFAPSPSLVSSCCCDLATTRGCPGCSCS